MILLIDNYDSFTYNLFQYLRMLDRETVVVRSDVIDTGSTRRLDPELIVISPGPGGPESTGNCRELLEAFHQRIPFLGICLGMQTIAQFFGARIIRAGEPMHGKTRATPHNGEGLFRGLPNPLRVTRYHSLVVDPATLPDCLEITAKSEDGEIMGLRHRTYSVSGVQFHPEAYLTENGLELLANALTATRC